MTDSEVLNSIRDLILTWCANAADPRPPAEVLADVMVRIAERDGERISAGLILDIAHRPTPPDR
jgi:hypothetical protein